MTRENVVKTLRGVRVPPVLTYIENITNIMIGRDIVKYDRLIPLIMEAFIIIHTSDLIERKQNIFHIIKRLFIGLYILYMMLPWKWAVHVLSTVLIST